MPQKLREPPAELPRAGFVLTDQAGSHEKRKHPMYAVGPLTLAGRDGTDAKPYQERELRKTLLHLRMLEIELARRTTPPGTRW